MVPGNPRGFIPVGATNEPTSSPPGMREGAADTGPAIEAGVMPTGMRPTAGSAGERPAAVGGWVSELEGTGAAPGRGNAANISLASRARISGSRGPWPGPGSLVLMVLVGGHVLEHGQSVFR
jgi:hypothetical protein